MKKNIIYIIIFFFIVSCKIENKQSKQITKVITKQIDIIKENKIPKVNLEKRSIYYVVANKLSFRDAPSLNSNKITVLKYLEPIYLIEDYPSKQETINDEGKTIIGNWLYGQLLNGMKGYVFNGFLKKGSDLGSLPRKGILNEELLINGKLKIHTTKKEFLNTLGKPDSIKSFKVVNDDNLIGKKSDYHKDNVYHIVENVAEYFGSELGDLMWFDNPQTKIYYTKGTEYEELDGKMVFLSVNFDVNQNFLNYDGFKIDSTTTQKVITTIFPITAKKNKWCVNEPNDCAFEFGSTRNNKNASEISWQLSLTNKTVSSFYFYFYD